MKDLKTVIGGTNEEIRDIRVNNVAQTIMDESEMAIQKLKMEYRAKQNHIADVLDFAPTSTTDLASALKNVNAGTLINDVYNTAEVMATLARRIKIRVAIHNQLFPNDKLDALSVQELDFLNKLV